jgi:hypothetical protein
MGYGGAAADSGGPEIFPALQHLVQNTLALLIDTKQRNQFFQDFVLRIRTKPQFDGIDLKALAKPHPTS